MHVEVGAPVVGAPVVGAVVGVEVGITGANTCTSTKFKYLCEPGASSLTTEPLSAGLHVKLTVPAVSPEVSDSHSVLSTQTCVSGAMLSSQQK